MHLVSGYHLTGLFAAGWRSVGASVGSAVSTSPAATLYLMLFAFTCTHHGHAAEALVELFVAAFTHGNPPGGLFPIWLVQSPICYRLLRAVRRYQPCLIPARGG